VREVDEREIRREGKGRKRKGEAYRRCGKEVGER
jgi:hypothetical protein